MKKWWQSRTLWTNLLMGVAYGVDKLAGFHVLPEYIMTPLALLANMYLRTITTKEVTL